MSSLFPRGKSIWIHFRDQRGVRHCVATGIKWNPRKREGRWLWPPEAIDFKRRIDAEVALDQFNMKPKKRVELRVKEALQKFHSMEGHRKASTREQDNYSVKLFVDNMGDLFVSEVNAETLHTFRQVLLQIPFKKNGEARRPATVAKTFRQLAVLFRWCEEEGIIDRTPFTRKVMPRLDPPDPVAYTEPEFRQLVAAARELDPALADQLLFLSLTGLRLGESCALVWKNVDQRTRSFKYLNEKGNRWEVFPLYGELEALIGRLPRESEFVFRYRERGRVYWAVKKLITQLKLDKRLTVHAIKKYYAMRLLAAGTSPKLLSELAHHRSLVTTLAHYIENASLEDKRRALEHASATVLLQLVTPSQDRRTA